MSLGPGWGYPADSRKAHYFPADDPTMALCRRYGFYGGHRRDEAHDSRENCAECMRRRNKSVQKNTASEGHS